MTTASRARVERWIDAFIRRAPRFGDSSDMWIDDPERASRCWDAAENGCDGSTHAEVIDGWREAFRAEMSRRANEPVHFIDAVEARFDAIEQWHEEHGSLHQEIG